MQFYKNLLVGRAKYSFYAAITLNWNAIFYRIKSN